MPFFIRKRGGKTDTRIKKTGSKTLGKGKPPVNRLPPSKKLKRQTERDNEEITSDEEEEYINRTPRDKGESQYKHIEEETPQEKKVRLAKEYLEELKKQKEEEIEDEEELNKAVGLKLKEDVLEAAGKLQRTVAYTFECPDAEFIKFMRCKHHKLSLTCLVVSSDEKFIYSASKDASIVKWDMEGHRLGVIPSAHKVQNPKIAHDSHILSMALSTDGKYLASGDRDGILHIWDGASLSLLKTFRKHRGAISGLTFRRGTHTLYSASHDRLVMAWSIDDMAYMECLGGHQDCITGIDALMRESCITSGGQDETVIVYVIPEEKQLRFSASQSSIDGVKLVNEKVFLTYGQDGSLALWSTLKKKPHFTVKAAHGVDPVSGVPFWVTAVAAYVNTDVIASGSSDGNVRLWKVVHNNRKLELMFTIPVSGVVNALEFTSSGSHLIAAIGQEHKLGRWVSEKKARNALVIIKLNKKS